MTEVMEAIPSQHAHKMLKLAAYFKCKVLIFSLAVDKFIMTYELKNTVVHAKAARTRNFIHHES